jgi:hypothetical protein
MPYGNTRKAFNWALDVKEPKSTPNFLNIYKLILVIINYPNGPNTYPKGPHDSGGFKR